MIANNSGEEFTYGESASETYNLDIYGTLEPGMYRLVVETLSAGFLVGHGRMAGTEGEEK